MNVIRKTLTLSTELHLSYLSWGEGKPVLLLHGLADHGLVWQRLAETLSHAATMGAQQPYCCIAPDLRGHGESSKPPETDYGADVLATDLEALVHHLNLQQVDVVAHSWAAKVALIWARQQPQRIRNLVLVDPFFVNRLPGIFRPTLPIFYRVLPFLKVMGPFETYGAAVNVARGLKQYRGWSALQAAVFQAGMTQQPDGQWGSKFAIAARNGVFQDVLQLAGLTEPLSTPTGLMLPEQGLNRRAWQLKPYRRYLTNLTTISIPGNHWPHLVEPEAFNQAVINFLGR